jgi:hypothetical protein
MHLEPAPLRSSPCPAESPPISIQLTRPPAFPAKTCSHLGTSIRNSVPPQRLQGSFCSCRRGSGLKVCVPRPVTASFRAANCHWVAPRICLTQHNQEHELTLFLEPNQTKPSLNWLGQSWGSLFGATKPTSFSTTTVYTLPSLHFSPLFCRHWYSSL